MSFLLLWCEKSFQAFQFNQSNPPFLFSLSFYSGKNNESRSTAPQTFLEQHHDHMLHSFIPLPRFDLFASTAG